ncbi:MAG TPA: carboxypeptidase regulatory-like domain-containing protein [Verrucomicrobiae bacterium]|nr:carboxypeptidase regulatory-like domain-containing protein [Verrucomicrobiae bacterium]
MGRILLDSGTVCNINSVQSLFFFALTGGAMLSHTRFLHFCIFSLSLLFFWTSNARAQVDRGNVVGTVTDPSAAAVAEAKVTVTNLETNQVVEVTTDELGNYSAKLLRIGHYSIKVEKTGFQSAIEANVEVGINQVVRVDISMRVGTATETVEVSGAPPLLQTDTSSLGTIETEKRITDLPLNGRNFIQLAYLGPGANAGQSGSNVSGGVFENERANEAISVNGLRVTNNNFLLNGVDNNEFGLGGTIVLPAPDAIQEFRTEENAMSAEFGRGGAAINVVLKSGTNNFHGGVYEFFRNDVLDAVNYFAPSREPFQRNQFGGFLGGPIRKNKTFVFGNYEGYRLNETDPFISSVPTIPERSGDFSQLLIQQGTQLVNPYTHAPIPNNRMDLATQPDGAPLINAVGSNAINLYPLPTVTDPSQPNYFQNNYTTTQKRVNNQNSFDIRVDEDFRTTDQLFVSYAYSNVNSSQPGPLGDLGGADCCPSESKSQGQHVGIGYTHTFSPTVVNDLHGGYFRYSVNALPFNYGKNLGLALGIPNSNRGDLNSSGLPNIDSAGYTPLGDSEWLPEHVYENIYQIADTVNWTKGKHAMKFGGDFRRQTRNFYQTMAPRGLFQFSGLYTGDGFGDLMTGIANYTEQDYLQGNYLTTYWDLAGFGQDDWRVTPRLTLNLGLRYEITSPAGGRVSNFNLNTATMDVGYGPGAIPRAGVAFDTNGWAPRIGLAYSLPRNTVIRSAFGIFHAAESNIFDDLGLNPPQDTFNAAQYSAANAPQTAQLISTGFPAEFPPYDPTNLFGSVKTTGSERVMPKILEWNLTLQHQFFKDWIFTAGYVGTHAYRLWNHESTNFNQPVQPLDSNFSGPVPSDCLSNNYGTPYFSQQPCLVSILPLDYAQLHTFYNAFQTSLNKQYSSGFNILVAYTFAQNLGNADGNVGTYIQNAHDVNGEYGPAAPDIKQRLSISGIYEIPVGRGRKYMNDSNAIVNGFIGGWEISTIIAAQTGEAVTAVLSSDVTNTGSSSPRPDTIHNPYDFSYDAADQGTSFQCSRPGHQTLDCWFNQAAFALPALAPGQTFARNWGNTPIGTLRGPGYVNFDVVFQKAFPIHESQQLLFRAEFFNIFNHPNFGLPGAGIAPTTGTAPVDVPGGSAITNTITPDANRQIEFALKYTF